MLSLAITLHNARHSGSQATHRHRELLTTSTEHATHGRHYRSLKSNLTPRLQLRKSKRRGVGVWVQSMPLHGHHHGGIIWGTSGRPLSCSAGPNPGLSGPLPGLLMLDPERARQGPEYPVCSRKRPEKRPDWHPEWTAAQTRNSLTLNSDPHLRARVGSARWVRFNAPRGVMAGVMDPASPPNAHFCFVLRFTHVVLKNNLGPPLLSCPGGLFF